MTVTPSSPVVGIFKDRSMAEQAIDALHTAGFASEQVRYSPPGTSGSILTDLKNMFTGQSASSGNITNDLTDMGLSNEEAQYYANEHNNGNTILAISAPDREQEALNILHQYGAYNARTSASSTSTNDLQQSADSAQQTIYPPAETSLQQNDTPDWATQQPSDIENQPVQNVQQDVTAPDTNTDAVVQDYPSDDETTVQNLAYQPTQPLEAGYSSTSQVTSTSDDETSASEAQISSSDSIAPATSYDEQAAPSNPMASDPTYTDQTTSSNPVASHSTFEAHTTPPDDAPSDATFTDQVAPSDFMTPGSTSTDQPTPSNPVASHSTFEAHTTSPDDAPSDATSFDQATLSDSAPSDATFTDQTTLSDPVASDATSMFSPPATTSTEPADELQQLQEQLQAAQQQLQDVRAQLQAAKEHEAQIQIIREREQQLQAARQQLQDIQAELQATMAELNETQGRISQY